MTLMAEDKTLARRWPGGKRKPQRVVRHAGVNNIAKRFEVNWDAMIAFGADERWGSSVGRLYMEGSLSSIQATAGIEYARLAGEYDRYHSISRRTPKSQSYQRSFGGQDDIVERHVQNGTVRSYERKAKRVKKRWQAIEDCMPNEAARRIVDDVCLYERDVPSSMSGDLAAVLNRIAHVLRLDHQHAEVKAPKPLSTKKKRDVVDGAIRAVENWFAFEKASPSHFRLLMDAPDGERGVCIYGVMSAHVLAHAEALVPGQAENGRWVRHSVLIKLKAPGRMFLEAELDALLVSACSTRGWIERTET